LLRPQPSPRFGTSQLIIMPGQFSSEMLYCCQQIFKNWFVRTYSSFFICYQGVVVKPLYIMTFLFILFCPKAIHPIELDHFCITYILLLPTKEFQY
jgi:hypothetical protein